MGVYGSFRGWSDVLRLDLSTLNGVMDSAVICNNIIEAKSFIKAMWEQYPEKMDTWEDGDIYYGREEGVRVYYPNLFDGDNRHLQVSRKTFLESNSRRYTVFQLTDLLQVDDFGEIVNARFDIKSLFGMG